MEVITILTIGTLNIACFLVGAKVGQTVTRGEEVKLPTVSPTKLHREKEDRREAEREKEKLNAILHNIECYDGTGKGQMDVPR